jgi:hypothetical protein
LGFGYPALELIPNNYGNQSERFIVVKKNSRLIIIGVLILILIGGVNTAYSVLRNRDHHMLRIAFMNGYVEALNLNIEEIEKLRKNSTLLFETVNSAADRYLGKVNNLNQ